MQKNNGYRFWMVKSRSVMGLKPSTEALDLSDLTCFHMDNYITKTRLFKYIENFTSKNWKFSEKKSADIFYISAQNIDSGYSCRGGSNEYPQSMFLSTNKKK